MARVQFTFTIIHGIFYSLVVNGYLFTLMITLSPRIWGYQDYPETIKQKVPPQTKRERLIAGIAGIPFFIFTFGFPVYSILRLLIEDSSQSYVQLSKKMNVHKDTVRKRINNLVEHKIIERYTININQENLQRMYPNLLNVIYALVIIRNAQKFTQELIGHKNVIEVDEASPASLHNLLIHTRFNNMNDFKEFTDWLKSNSDLDVSRLMIIPIYKQHKRRKKMITIINGKK